MHLLRLYLIFLPTAPPLPFSGESQLRFSTHSQQILDDYLCYRMQQEKNASNTHGPCIISGCRRSSGCAHHGKVFPQFHLRQSPGSTHTGTLYFSCGQVMVRHDPCAWERRGVPTPGTHRKMEDNVLGGPIRLSTPLSECLSVKRAVRATIRSPPMNRKDE